MFLTKFSKELGIIMNRMLNGCLKFIVLCFIATLFGCLKQEGCGNNKACQNTCLTRLAYCEKSCDNSCVQCCKKSVLDAENRYDHYYHEQKIKGTWLMRELLSYRDPLQCIKTTCNCMSDFKLCLQSNSKQINKHLQVLPACS